MSRIAVAASALMSAVAIVSCVNADYDLSKPIDMTVAVDGDISMPLIKNSEFITVGELLKDTDLGENIELVPLLPVRIRKILTPDAIICLRSKGTRTILSAAISASWTLTLPKVFKTLILSHLQRPLH